MNKREMKFLEIRGILRVLSEQSGQGIASPKRLMQLNKFLREEEQKKKIRKVASRIRKEAKEFYK